MLSSIVSGADNSAAAVLLDRIALGEGTSDADAEDHGLASAYDITFGYGQYNPEDSKPLSQMTIAEVKQLQQQMIANGAISSAVGKYQIIDTTLDARQTQLGLSDDTTFDSTTQDSFGVALLDRRGYSDWLAGTITDDQFQRNLALEWASIADPDTGKSAYRNNGDLAQPGDVEGSGPTDLQHVRTTTEQIREAMATTKMLLEATIFGEWNIHYQWPNENGDSMIFFRNDGTFTVSYDSNTDELGDGKWNQNGDEIHFKSDYGTAAYVGTIISSSMSGTMSDDYGVQGEWSADKRYYGTTEYLA